MPNSAVVQRDVTVQHGSQWQKQVSRSYPAGQGSKETCRRAPRLQNASRASHRSAQQRLAGAIMGATASPSTPSAKIEAARLGGPGPRVLEGLEPIAAAQLIIGAREAGVVGLLGKNWASPVYSLPLDVFLRGEETSARSVVQDISCLRRLCQCGRSAARQEVANGQRLICCNSSRYLFSSATVRFWAGFRIPKSATPEIRDGSKGSE